MEIITSSVEDFVKKQTASKRKASLVTTSKGARCLLIQTLPLHVFRAYLVTENTLTDVGVLTLSPDQDDARLIELSAVKVEEQFRGLGIGSMLVKKALASIIESGRYEFVRVTSFKSTMEFFEKFGFNVADDQLSCLTVWPERTLVTMDLPLVKNYRQHNEL